MAIKTPSPENFLRGALDTNATEALRVNAAREAAWRMKEQLADRLRVLFPGFYWEHSEFLHIDGMDFVNLRFPQVKTWRPDDELTGERQRALMELGFTHVEGEPLGVCSAQVEPTCVGTHG
jgi:hypothetical protein